jgi:hypothetical protein
MDPTCIHDVALDMDCEQCEAEYYEKNQEFSDDELHYEREPEIDPQTGFLHE